MEFKVKLRDKREEARETKTFILERPQGFSYVAGQYAFFTVPELLIPDERGDTRHFTLSSSPTEDFLSFTTRMRKESGFKQTLDQLELGTKLMMRGPNGVFVLENESEQKEQVMIAGGIGITPYRSIIRYVADKNLSVPIHLICSNSLPEDIAFKDEFDTIVKNHENIKISYTVSRPEESKVGWDGLTGRIDEKMLGKLVPDLDQPTFWLCGPPGMVQALEELLDQLRVPADNIRVERFTGY